MKTKRYFLLAFCWFTLTSFMVQAEDLRKIVSLSGNWKFSVGDDIRWASPSYNDSKWDEIRVPDRWEDQGYNDYNGYAWYRKTFSIGKILSGNPIYLVFGNIDDADVVYLNGKVIGKSGNFPPDFKTAADRRRKYIIPDGCLKEDAENTIAVQVYDTYLEGGIIEGPAGIYADADDDYLSLNLSGMWKFHTGDNKEWRSPDYNDAKWGKIRVPSVWENEGYDGYDGYAWYRIEFKMPPSISDDELYLSLGKIDDYDDVYLNGEHIGSVYNLKKDGEYRRQGMEYNARRIYKIPRDVLNYKGVNTIAVRVFDERWNGGIYEGPVGIMSSKNCERYRNKYQDRRSIWDYWFD
jgi:hypothetical protein